MLMTVITNVPFDELFLPPKSLPRPTVALTLCERGNRKKACPHNKFIVPMMGSTYLKSGMIAICNNNPSRVSLITIHPHTRPGMHMNALDAAKSGSFKIGNEFDVNRLGFGDAHYGRCDLGRTEGSHGSDPGTSKVKHLEENVAAADIVLSDDEFAALDEAGKKHASR